MFESLMKPWPFKSKPRGGAVGLWMSYLIAPQFPLFSEDKTQHWNMYIINCETDRQSRFDAWDKCSGLVHWEDPEGWDGEGGGRGVQDGEHM